MYAIAIKCKKVIFLFLLFLLSQSYFSQCIQIESILVDACGSPEGENEMVRFSVGSTALNTADMSVVWPNGMNPWRNICQNATTANAVAALNATILGCGWLIEPTGGVLPANAKVLLITSTAIDVNANSFTALSDTLYTIFQCAGNTSGHFANWSTGSGLRTLTISFTNPIGCSDVVTYDKVLLVNQNGTIGGTAAIRDGALVNFDAAGNPTYENFGCQAPFVPANVDIFALSPTTICLGSTNPIQLYASGSSSITSLSWTGNNGTFNSTTNDTVIYTPSINDTVNFYITVEGISSCGNVKDSILITVISPITATQNVSICAGQTFTLPSGLVVNTAGAFIDTLVGVAPSGCDSIITTNLTIISPLTATQNVSICAGQTFTLPSGLVVNTAGAFIDTLVGVAPSGCDSIITTNLTVNSLPTVTANANPSSPICLGNSVTLTGGGAVTYLWDNGATNGVAFNPTLGSTLYTVTGTDANGCSNTDTITIQTINCVNLTASFNPSSLVICQGDSITFTDNSIGTITNWNWTFNGGNPATANTQGPHAVVFNTAGTFNITLQVTDASGVDDTTIAITVNPTTSLTQNFIECAGFSVTVGSNTYTTTGIFIDTLQTTSGCDSIITTNLTIISPLTATQNVSICAGQTFTLPSGLVVNTAGAFIDTLVGVAPSGCDSIITTNLTVNSLPTVTANANPSSPICLGNSVTLTGGGAVNYLWDNGATNGVAFNPTLGSTLYTVTGTDANGCSNTDTITIQTINCVNLTASFNPSSLVICQGDSITFTDNSIGTITNWNWTFNGGNPATANTQGPHTVVFNTAGTFNITLQVTDASGVDDTTIAITVNPTTSLTQNFIECAGFSVTVGSNTYTTTGIFIDTLQTSSGCDSIVTTNLTINQFVPVQLVENDTTLCQDEFPSLVLHSVGGTNLSWSDGTTSQDSLVVTQNGFYTVTSTNNGCIAQDNVQVTFEVCIDPIIFIPNVFTPNNDGMNDEFKMLGTFINQFEGTIFNRWGKELFNWNDINQGWNGEYEGKLVPDGTYVYIIDVVFDDRTKKTFTGSVTLLK